MILAISATMFDPWSNRSVPTSSQKMRTLATVFKIAPRTQMLEAFSEGAMGTDINPYPEGSADALMDVSQSNTYSMSAPASGPYEYGEKTILCRPLHQIFSHSCAHFLVG